MRRVQSAADKDAPLRYDIRLLGRILGETVRAQEGERTFDIIERIRLTALRFHRDADASAGHDLQTIIKGIGDREAIQIIRAFGYFSHWRISQKTSITSVVAGPMPGPMPRHARGRSSMRWDVRAPRGYRDLLLKSSSRRLCAVQS